jgi:ribosomal protein S18 acetylase RimI-like enzyme
VSDTDLIQALEEMALNAVPALETRHFRGWAIRTAAGVTGRANSATALHPGACPVDEAASEVVARAGAAGVAPRFRITPLAPEGSAARLSALGWTAETPVLTQVADLPAGLAPEPGVELLPTSDAAWRRQYAVNAGRFGPAELDVLGRLHRMIPVPVAFARLVEDGRNAAIGFATAERGWASLHEIGVDPAFRRGGRAGRIVNALLGWAAGEGARRVWLQVSADNAPAIALYRRLGFETAFNYEYFRR